MKWRITLLVVGLLAIVSAAVANIAPPLLPAFGPSNVGQTLQVATGPVVVWGAVTGAAGAIMGPVASTNNDLAAWSGTGGNALVDSGILGANVVLVSRNVNAGTGLLGGGSLTSDVTLSAKLTGPAASTNNDVTCWSGTGGTSLIDCGFGSANVVQTSRQVIAGTGIAVTPQQQLTSDITVAMSMLDNQALTVGGAFTCNGTATIATGPLSFTNTTSGNNTVKSPTGQNQSLTFQDASGNIIAGIYTGQNAYAGGTPRVPNSNVTGSSFFVDGYLLFAAPANGGNAVIMPTGFGNSITFKTANNDTIANFDTSNTANYGTGVLKANNAFVGTLYTSSILDSSGGFTAEQISGSGHVTIYQGDIAFGQGSNSSVPHNVKFTNTTTAKNYLVVPTGLTDAFNVQDAGGSEYMTLNTNASTTSVAIRGSIAGDSASAGFVGEYISAALTAASGVTSSSNVVVNIKSISLTAGDWDIAGQCNTTGNLTGTEFACGVSATSGTMPGAGSKGDTWVETPTVSSTSADSTISVDAVRVSLSSTTPYYLVTKATVTVGTPTFYGRISARRVR